MPSSNRQTHALRTFLLLVHCIILHWAIKKHSWLMTSAKTTEQCRSPQVTTMLTAVASPELVANMSSMLNKLGGGVQASLVDVGSEPTLKDAVVCRAATAFRLVPFDAPGADSRVPLVKVTRSHLGFDSKGLFIHMTVFIVIHLHESCKVGKSLLCRWSCSDGSMCGSRS